MVYFSSLYEYGGYRTGVGRYYWNSMAVNWDDGSQFSHERLVYQWGPYVAQNYLNYMIPIYQHREHTILLNRMRVNKGMKQFTFVSCCHLLPDLTGKISPESLNFVVSTKPIKRKKYNLCLEYFRRNLGEQGWCSSESARLPSMWRSHT